MVIIRNARATPSEVVETTGAFQILERVELIEKEEKEEALRLSMNGNQFHVA